MTTHKIKTIISQIGIDKSIAYTSGARIVQALSGVISIFFIAIFLSSEEQGFFFTFASITALQVFFELGFTTILMQFVAHEVATLKWNDRSILEGEKRNLSRLSSLIHFALKWYSWISLILILVLLLTGSLFFGFYNNHTHVNWEIPWALAAVSVSSKLIISPFQSILMGLGKIKEVSKMQFGQQLLNSMITLCGLAIGWKLYVIGAAMLFSSLYCICYMHFSGLLKIIHNIYKREITHKISYRKEIFPFQWKMSISWMSGYFIYHLFNPVLFATAGPIQAGQMGLTIQAVNGIVVLSASWMSTKIPVFSKFIALKDYLSLDKLFNKTLKQMLFVSISLYGVFLLMILSLYYTNFSIDNKVVYLRFLPFFPLILMIVATSINQVVATLASYLRCHKQEPFLAYSIALGCASLILIPISGKLYELNGVCICYFLLQLIFSPWGYYIYRTKKQQWHKV